MLAYDLRNGIWLRRIWLLIPITFFGMAACFVAPYMRSGEYDMTLGAVLFKLLQGSAPVDMEMRDFHVPMVWLMLQLGCVFFTVEYPTHDMNTFGQQIMIRGNGKGQWLLCKYIWNTVSVLIYWIIGYGMMAGLCVAHKTSLSPGISGEIVGGMDGCDRLREYFQWRDTVMLLVIMPVLVSLAISFIQMFTAIMLNDIFSISVSIFILVWSMCVMNPLAIGNYSMMQRSDMFNSKGLNFEKGIFIITAIILVTAISNYILFKRRDILEPKKNGG